LFLGAAAKRAYLDLAVAQSVEVLNHLTATAVTATPTQPYVPRPDLTALFEAAKVSFMVIERTHVKTVRCFKDLEHCFKIKAVMDLEEKTQVTTIRYFKDSEHCLKINVSMEIVTVTKTVVKTVMEWVEEKTVKRVPQRPPKVLIDEFNNTVKWFQDAIEAENHYLFQLSTKVCFLGPKQNIFPVRLEQHIAGLMADHQHHFLQRHMLLSKLMSLVHPKLCLC